jgi:hypothetical protein
MSSVQGMVLHLPGLENTAHGNRTRRFRGKHEIAFGYFAIRTKNVMFLARGRSVAFHPLFCLGMQRGKMVVLNRLRRPRKVHGLVGLTFWSRRRYVHFVFLEEQNSPWNS